MRSRYYLLLTALLGALLSLPGCQRQVVSTSKADLEITVSIAPQEYFLKRVGGERVAVTVMVQPGASPATYEPKPAQLRALSRADAYMSIGVPFEDAWLERISSANPDMLIVDTARGIQRRPMETRSDQGSQGDGERANLDPHIWLSPRLVRIQAQNIAGTLIDLDPAHRADYEANLQLFLADVDALENDIRGTLTGVKSRKFMVFHPSWGYFADDFGLEQLAIEIGGQEPSAQELAELITEAREEKIHVILAQPEFSTKAAETIAQEIDGEVLKISPLAEDWPANLRSVAQTFAEALGQ